MPPAKAIRAVRFTLRKITPHDPQYTFELGQCFALVSLGARRGHHRHAGLWLVDEPHPATAGPLFPSLDPCRYRLPDPAVDVAPPDLARHPSDAGIAGQCAAMAADGGARQLRRAPCDYHSGGGAGWAHSGAHTPDYADWFGLFHVPQITSPDKEAARAYEDRH